MATYFSYDGDPILACPCCGTRGISDSFLDHLDALRHACGFPIKVNSGYRCPVYNSLVSTTGPEGPHTREAVDLAVSFERAYILIEQAIRLGWTGIGVSQRGPYEDRFVHLDRLGFPSPRPRIWSY